jgi:hypothetical protein
MYEVYSAAIRSLFLNRGDETRSRDDLRANLAVIGDHTVPYRWEEWKEQMAEEWAKSDVSVENRTAEDFKRKCENSISLEPRFTIPIKQVLISDRELDHFFQSNGTSWQGFYKSYPQIDGSYLPVEGRVQSQLRSGPSNYRCRLR